MNDEVNIFPMTLRQKRILLIKVMVEKEPRITLSEVARRFSMPVSSAKDLFDEFFDLYEVKGEVVRRKLNEIK